MSKLKVTIEFFDREALLYANKLYWAAQLLRQEGMHEPANDMEELSEKFVQQIAQQVPSKRLTTITK